MTVLGALKLRPEKGPLRPRRPGLPALPVKEDEAGEPTQPIGDAVWRQYKSIQDLFPHFHKN